MDRCVCCICGELKNSFHLLIGIQERMRWLQMNQAMARTVCYCLCIPALERKS